MQELAKKAQPLAAALSTESSVSMDISWVADTHNNLDKIDVPDREEALTVMVPGPDGDFMSLDIPDIHNFASVSRHVTEFCERFTEMLAYFTHSLATKDACFVEMMKRVNEQTGKNYELLPESTCYDKQGAVSTSKVLRMF